MQRPKNLLIVVADGEHVRFVRQAPDFALHTVSSREAEFAHRRDSEVGRGAPGAAFHSGSSAHHGMAPRHDPRELREQRFARQIAEELNTMAAHDDYSELVLAAPSDTLSAVREGLDRIAASRLVGALPQDLVKIPDHELQPHLREWARPVHRPAG
jgi:protein required for attachment to host cells